MKKFGYTLAEVLITLMIVGVLAALTVPMVTVSAQKQKNASALAVAISDWESAMAAMMSADAATELAETAAWKELGGGELSGSTRDDAIKVFMGEMSKFLNMNTYYKGFQKLYDDNIKKINETEITDRSDGVYADYLVLVSKKGPAYGINITNSEMGGDKGDYTEDVILGAGGTLTAITGSVQIDVNGKDKPNTYGRDIFLFDLGTDGRLYPHGGMDYSVYTAGDDSKTWENAEGEDGCSDITKSAGWSCTSRLMENGFKVDY